MQVLVSVVVVNFNSGSFVTRAVGSVLESVVPVEVIVVDNGSREDDLKYLRMQHGGDSRLRVIQNRRNLGFARACNQGIRGAHGQYLLLLNPDCMLAPGTLGQMVVQLQRHPQVGLAGCMVRNPDGSEQAGCRRSVPTPWRTVVRVLNLDKLFPNHSRFRNFVLTRQPLPDASTFVEAISGAFMLVRREALEQVGLLDEKYFLHCEDLDWCMRFRRAGWRILFVPDVEVVHHQGTCSKDRPVFVLWNKHKGMVRFYHKFFRHQYPWPLMPLVVVAVWTRFILLAAMALFQRQKLSEPVNTNQDRISVKPAAPDEGITPPGVRPSTGLAEIDPMLVISSNEAQRPYSRLP